MGGDATAGGSCMSQDLIAGERGATETRVLIASLAVTSLVAAGGLACGLLSGSMAIIFDGLFSGIDAVMTAVALHVAGLVAREADRRHQFGYWHFEPLVLALNSCVLVLLCTYAFINAIAGLMSGGSLPKFGLALGYTGLVSVVCVGMHLYQRRANRLIGSDFIRLDMHSWLVSAIITTALVVSFSVALLIRGTRFEWLAPYVDPAVLAVLSLPLMAAPLASARRAFREMTLVTPRRLDRRVSRVLGEFVERRRLAGFTSYAAKVGRAVFIEVYVILPYGFPLSGIEDLDAMRAEIDELIGHADGDRWLTVVFTGDARWT
jgi:predicted Co/Zn/Cd cation transporter (cation efflux family)